jgi:DNA mismatch repair protein MutL
MFVPRAAPPEEAAPRFAGPAPTRALGVAFGRYLVAERGDRLALVDLRAVVERRRYEALLERARRGEAGAGQRLLVPRVVELSPAAAERARDLAGELETLGFEVEDFGGASVAIVARPADVDDRDVEALLVDLLAGEGEGGPDATARRRERWARRAARAGARVPTSPEARDELLTALERDARLRRSLDGRPTLVELSAAALERLFEDRR